jgi:hypothetical protein
MTSSAPSSINAKPLDPARASGSSTASGLPQNESRKPSVQLRDTGSGLTAVTLPSRSCNARMDGNRSRSRSRDSRMYSEKSHILARLAHRGERLERARSNLRPWPGSLSPLSVPKPP